MDRQVRRMVAHRTGDESNANVDSNAEVIAITTVPSDSDDDTKNDNVSYIFSNVIR